MTIPRIGLIGYPIEGSLSPALHRILYRLAKVEATYELWPIAPDAWPEDFAEQMRRDWHGFNVTTPHKENAFRACQHFSEAAMVLGAVNHIALRHDRGLIGDNKDVDGAYFTLQGIRASNPERPVSWLQTLHVLGCGPAARAVGLAYLRFWRAERARAKAAKKRDPGPGTLTWYVRREDPEREQTLARLRETVGTDLALDVVPWDRLLASSPITGLLVNATTAVATSPLAELPDGDYCAWDLNYGGSVFAQEAKESYRFTIDGLPMLVWQGFFSATRWFPMQIDPQRSLGFAKQVLDELRAMQ